MLIAIGGPTGTGKSFFCESVPKYVDFKHITTIRTRAPRRGEVNGGSTLFMTPQQLDDLQKEQKLALRRELLGYEYAYLSSEVFSHENYLMEVYATFMDQWKSIRPDIKSIYILPYDVRVAKQKLRERRLSPEREKVRMDDLVSQYDLFLSSPELQKKFDAVFINYFNKTSEEKMKELVCKMKKESEEIERDSPVSCLQKMTPVYV